MKINYRTMLIAGTIILLFAVFRRDSLDEVVFTENLDDVISPVEIKNYVVDFEQCSEEDNYIAATGLGRTRFGILNRNSDTCHVQITFESSTGSFTNDCEIPFSAGTMEFDGENFDQIAQYCKIPSTGEGMLELN